MVTAKTTTLTFRIEPGLKKKRCARPPSASTANMVEVMIRDYCGRHRITNRGAGTVF